MRIGWADLSSNRAAGLDGAVVELEGWAVAVMRGESTDHFVLTEEPACCGTCLPQAPERRVEVFAAEAMPLPDSLVRIRGRLTVLSDDPDGWRYQIQAAAFLVGPLPAQHAGFTRRHMLGTAALLGLSSWAPQRAAAQAVDPEPGRQALEGALTIDIHSHAGSVNRLRRIKERLPATPVAAPMRAGGMAVICLAAVADSPATRLDADRRIRPFRQPAKGELYAHSVRVFEYMAAAITEQGLGRITTLAELDAATAGNPGVIVASEGADFLEGQLDRVDEAYTRWGLRHLQLTHYRVNELGDIQTEPPVHGGLTDFGAAVIARCNQLGIVVDVAHAPYEMVVRAARETRKPLVLSHSSLSSSPRQFSRQISLEHARLIAGTGGVIGVWPPKSIFEDIGEMAAGMIRLAKRIGTDHVGLGTDMQGLVGGSVLEDYAQLPRLATALLQGGLSPEDVRRLLGGNYARVFRETMST